MPSITEAAATAMDGLADFIATTEGLRPVDGWKVCSGPIDPLPSQKVVLFGNATITQSQTGLVGSGGDVNWTGWVMVFRSQLSGEDATREVRRIAAEAMGRIEAAVEADPTAAGTIRPPGGTKITSSGVEQSLSDWNGQAGQQARVPFTITWTSHSG